MKKRERIFTKEEFETRSEDIRQNIANARLQIRKALLNKSTPAQKKKLEKALGGYGTEKAQDFKLSYNAFIENAVSEFYAEQIITYDIREYARDFGAEKVLALKDSVFASEKEVVRYMQKTVHTFDDLKKISDRSLQNLLWNLEWLDIVRALKTAPKIIRNAFFKNVSTRTKKLMVDGVEKSPATPEESREAQRRIVRMAYALGLFY